MYHCWIDQIALAVLKILVEQTKQPATWTRYQPVYFVMYSNYFNYLKNLEDLFFTPPTCFIKGKMLSTLPMATTLFPLTKAIRPRGGQAAKVSMHTGFSVVISTKATSPVTGWKNEGNEVYPSSILLDFLPLPCQSWGPSWSWKRSIWQGK